MKYVNRCIVQINFYIALLLLSTTTQAEPPTTLYTAGFGMGRSTVSGDYSMEFVHPTFELGFDYESEHVLFQFIGSTAFDNTFKSLHLFVGGGNRYIKLGLGMIGMNSSIPTKKQTFLFSTADESRYTRASASSMPIILRLHPYSSDSFIFTLDGHYGLKNNGSLTIPILTFGIPGKFDTEPQRSQNRYGYGASVLWRPSHNYNFAIRLAYTYNYGEMNSSTTTMNNKLFGSLIQIETPQLVFETEQIILSVVWVAD